MAEAPVTSAAWLTPWILPVTSWVPAEARWVLAAISLVAAPCWVTDEAMALAAVARCDVFADWGVRLPGTSPALRAAGLLKRWLTDGLVAGLSTS